MPSSRLSSFAAGRPDKRSNKYEEESQALRLRRKQRKLASESRGLGCHLIEQRGDITSIFILKPVSAAEAIRSFWKRADRPAWAGRKRNPSNQSSRRELEDRGEYRQAAGAVARAIIRSVELIARTSRLSGLGLYSLCFSFLRQLAQQPHRQPNRVGDALNLRCSFATTSFDFYYPAFNRIGSVNSAPVKSSRNFYPVSRLLHTLSLIEAAPGVHPAWTRPANRGR